MRSSLYITNRYLILTVAALCFFGMGVLSFAGYEMGSDAPSTFTKIHPVSYILLFASLINISRLNDKAQVFRGVANNIPEYRLLALIAVIFLYLYLSGNLSSISFIVDTLLCPVLLSLNFRHYPGRFKWDARNLCIRMVLLNSYIAIFERIFSINLFPINAYFGDVFRSTALLGHPLNNALITLVAFLYAASVPIPLMRKMYIMTVFLTGLICFGARGSLYVAVLSLFLFFIIPVFVSKSAYFKRINKAWIMLLVGTMTALLLYLMLNTTLGERLVQASFYDSSAEVRTQAFDVINFHDIGSYLFAKSQSEIERMSYYADVEIIENFFIVWMLKFGLIITLLLLLFIYRLFYARLPVKGKINRHLVILMLLFAAATNNSLATNTQALSVFVIFFVIPQPVKSLRHA